MESTTNTLFFSYFLILFLLAKVVTYFIKPNMESAAKNTNTSPSKTKPKTNFLHEVTTQAWGDIASLIPKPVPAPTKTPAPASKQASK